MSTPFVKWSRRYLSWELWILIAVIVYLLFFQENSSDKIYAYQQTIDSLKAEIRAQNDTMAYYRELNRRLDNHDPEIIEKVVREHHNMKTVDEEVYIFTTTPASDKTTD